MGFHTTELHKTGSETNWFHFDSLMSKLDFVKPWKLLAQTKRLHPSRVVWWHLSEKGTVENIKMTFGNILNANLWPIWLDEGKTTFFVWLLYRENQAYFHHIVCYSHRPHVKKKANLKSPAVPNCDLKKKKKVFCFCSFFAFVFAKIPPSCREVVWC